MVVSAPKCGTVLDTAQSRAGAISTKWTARVSPTSALSTAIGPVIGSRNGNVHTSLRRSPMVRTTTPVAVLGGELNHGAGRDSEQRLPAPEGERVLLGGGAQTADLGP